MFIVKLFRGGTRNPRQIEFYTTPTPVIKPMVNGENPGILHQVEIPIQNKSEMIDVMEGDVCFIENADGVTIHSIRN